MFGTRLQHCISVLASPRTEHRRQAVAHKVDRCFRAIHCPVSFFFKQWSLHVCPLLLGSVHIELRALISKDRSQRDSFSVWGFRNACAGVRAASLHAELLHVVDDAREDANLARQPRVLGGLGQFGASC